MSTAIAKNIQIGADPTATNNFTIFQPATPDGTLRIGNGNTGITTSLLSLTSTGAIGVGGANYGTSGQFLQSNGTAAPSWVSAPIANNGTLTMNVSGTGLSGSQTFTANQAGNATFTVTSNATNANTANAIVARDASGNFTAGTVSVTRLTATPNTSGVSTGITAVNGDMTAYRSGGTTGVIYLSSAGSHYLYWDGGTYYLNAGNLAVTGNVTAYSSDSRLKKNVKNIPNALEKVKQIRGVTYDWDLEECKKWEFFPPKDDVGVIAQEVQAVQPHAVKFAPFDRDPMDNGVSKSGKDYLTVQYEKLVPLLIEAIKELEAKVAALEAKG